jgi:hypothetical protein
MKPSALLLVRLGADAREAEIAAGVAKGIQLNPSVPNTTLTVAGETPRPLAISCQKDACRAARRAPASGGATRTAATSGEKPDYAFVSSRLNHLRAVRGQTPAACSAASGACPLRITERHNHPLSIVRRHSGLGWTPRTHPPAIIPLRPPPFG